MRLDRMVAGEGGKVALVARGQSLTYAELETEIARVAAGFARRLPPGERLAIWLPKTLEAVVAFLAAARAGLVAVPVNPVLRHQQVQHILADSGARLLVSQKGRVATLQWAGEILTVEDDWPGLGGAAVAAENTLAALLYTSGSTGQPKGVMISHENLVLGIEAVVSYLGLTSTDVVLSVLPLSFDFGLSQVTTGLAVGATVVLLDYLLPRDVVRAVGRHGVTVLAAVPPLWANLVGQAWGAEGETLRVLSNSGGRLPVPVVERLRRLFPEAALHLMYGLTEAFRSTTLPPALVDSHPTSIGRAIPHAEILVMATPGRLAADGEPGELVHCGPLVTQGYWHDPERTAARFRPAPAASHYGGVAVWSGDRVVRDADGLLTFVGREDDSIKTMGTRVSPTEIEELAYQSSAVGEVVALGIPDAYAGHLVWLVASPAAGLAADAAEEQLRHYLKQEGPSYMQPAEIVWLAELPRSANGKLDRAALRATYGRPAPGSSALKGP